MTEMNCDELVERVTDYLDDALPPQDQVRLDEHIAVCFGCIAHLGEVRSMLRIISSIPAAPVQDGMEERLLAVHRRWVGSVGT